MRYEVKLTVQAIEQIEEAIQYISNELQSPEIAQKWADVLQRSIVKLETMPSRYALTEEEPWHTRGIHKMPVKNFLVYYLVNEEKKTVWVTAVIYERRDQVAVLSDISRDFFI